MSSEVVAVVFSVGSGILAWAISWGSMRAKHDALTDRMILVESRLMTDYFVTQKQFEMSIGQLRQEQKESQKDIKRILEILSQVKRCQDGCEKEN